MSATPVQLYRHFDASGKLLYVGISKNSGTRFSQHRRTATWGRLSVRMTVEVFPDRLAAEAAELKAISTEKPVHNRIGRLTVAKLPKLLEKPRRLEETVMISARVLLSVAERANKHCAKKGMSRSELIEQALKKFLKMA